MQKYFYFFSFATKKTGLGKLSVADLELGVQFCSHLVYGYLGINPNTYQAYSLQEDLDIHRHQFFEVTALKQKYPHLKVLLSLGGDADIDPDHPNKYMELLEGDRNRQIGFMTSVQHLIRSYGFDGLDLAYQFPKNKPRKVHSEIGTLWKKFKKVFTGNFIVDPKSDEHKEQFTTIVRDLRNILHADGYQLMLTVLPNVNSSCKLFLFWKIKANHVYFLFFPC